MDYKYTQYTLGESDLEFKDKLRKLRKEKEISQQKLAEFIIVSRSAVAKWENGLGFPCEDSLKALSEYFGVDMDYWKTDEPEIIIVEKNKKLSRIKFIAEICFVVIVICINVLALVSIFCDNFWLTSKGASSRYNGDSNQLCIKTSDYDIYYSLLPFAEETTDSDYKYYQSIRSIRPIKKMPVGYALFEEDMQYSYVYDKDGEERAIFYSIEGDDGYYNFFTRVMVIGGKEESPAYFYGVDTVTVNGKSYDVTLNSFFISDEPVEKFYIGDIELIVGEIVEE